jgi:hypothetical protein
MLDGFAASAAERTRGRLARVLGDVREALDLALSLEPGSRLRRLAEVVGGRESLERFASEVARSGSTVEEVIIAAQHVAKGVLPPPLPLLDASEEMCAVRRHIAAGDVTKILTASRETTACPRCNYGLPDVQRLRLASIGIARATNCCNRVLLVGVD